MLVHTFYTRIIIQVWKQLLVGRSTCRDKLLELYPSDSWSPSISVSVHICFSSPKSEAHFNPEAILIVEIDFQEAFQHRGSCGDHQVGFF